MSKYDPAKKTRISLDIDEEILADFRAEVIRFHGRSYGNMYTEWNNALKEYTEKLRQATDKKRRQARAPVSTTMFGEDDQS